MAAVHTRSLIGVLAALFGILLGIVIVATRDSPSPTTTAVNFQMSVQHTLDPSMSYEMRIVAASLCKSHQVVTEPRSPNYDRVSSRECAPLFLRDFSYHGGCISDSQYDNLNSGTYTFRAYSMVPTQAYTHLSLKYEPIVRIRGSLYVDNTTQIYTQNCGFETCPPTCSSIDCGSNTCASTNLQGSPGVSAAVDFARFGNEINVPFHEPFVPDPRNNLVGGQAVYAKADLAGAVQAHNTTENSYYGIATASHHMIVQHPRFVAYAYHHPTITTFTANINYGSPTHTAADVCPDYDYTLDTHPADGTHATATSLQFSFYKKDATPLSISVAITDSEAGYVFPIEAWSLSTNAGLTNITQVMYDGTACPRIWNLDVVDPTQSTPYILIGDNYYSVVNFIAA